ncbi:hypothetical protein WGM54_14425 [Paenibacillus polymyxa]|uniref:hypothetical protein n=1 Tax=Paenibacillus polymyxa TaxID=1406 RepID=UPI00307DDFAC
MKSLLIEVKEYLEKDMLDYASEWGDFTLEDLIKNEDMPSVYYKVIDKIKEMSN